MSPVDPVKLRELHKTLEELQRRKRENALAHYVPYEKQKQFHAAGKTHRERLFVAGNQCGKSLAGCAEMAMHLLGEYPSWFEGRRFNRPVRAWSLGVTGEATRDTTQRLLLGPLGARGTGMIPADAILEVRAGRGIGDTVDTALIRHKSGHTSHLGFKSYEKGRQKLQGESIDVIHCDEEPDIAEYSECLARISATGGLIYITFTPLLGRSTVVQRFFNEESPDRALVTMTLADAGHFSDDDRKRITAGYQEFERDARCLGIPLLGSGRIYGVAESVLSIPAMPIPEHWPRICAIDMGFQNFAAVWLAWDRDSDTIFVIDCLKSKEQTPVIHSAAIKARGDWPVAWPQDALQHSKGDGIALRDLYKQQGLRMLHEHAQYENGSTSVEAGLMDALDRMKSGRWKVFSHLNEWWEEFRVYHRDNGRVVKVDDHLMDASRYGLMSLRFATTGQGRRGRGGRSRIADGVDPSPWFDPDPGQSYRSRRDSPMPGQKGYQGGWR